MTPHHRLTGNPLFSLETRRIPWGYSERALLRFSARLLEIVVGLTLLVWWFLARPDRVYTYSSGASFGSFAPLLFAFGLLAGLLLDCLGMASSFGSLSAEVSAGRWEVLRLTLLPVEYIVAAKHGVAQVRVWRYTILLVAFRLAVSVMLVITLFLSLYRGGLASPDFSLAQALAALPTLLMLAALSALYVLEPFWRVRMVTALGVAVSARAWQGSSSLLLAVAVLGALWLAGLFVAVIVAFGASLALAQLGFSAGSLAQTLVCAPLIIAALFVTIYGFYSVVQIWSLRRAESWIARWHAN